ncbi:MAG: site-specific DNA-methyltransferase [Proteobacteria bacterium]|nr:site-specific DNA-methyltransferase [Pseudomonadota bacterium]
MRALAELPDECVGLVYIDPPFNTGKRRRLTQLRTELDPDGDRTGFGGRRYRTTRLRSMSYGDDYDEYLSFLEPRLREARRVLRRDGSIFVHLDCREVHYCKVLMDGLFGRDNFQNEIIWSYDFGARSRSRWSRKHDNLLWYSRSPKAYSYNFDAVDRIPYMAPGLVGKEKAARGKTPTDVWWQTIVPTNGCERTGYPTQKPLKILDRIVRVHSKPGDLVLDFFAGSGTSGEAAGMHGRAFLMVDHNPEAIAVMSRRLSRFEPLMVDLAQPDAAAVQLALPT